MYRRRRSDRPNLRWRRVIALAGTILFHLFILVFVVLGPAYEPPPPKDDNASDALQVRLITPDEKKQPPPPPPVRGTPPKKLGPVHKGSAVAKAEPHRSRNAATGAPAATDATPVTAKQEPVVAYAKPSAPKQEKAAAPKPPQTLPKPAPAPELQAVKVDSQPPPVTLEQPPTPQPAPPKFQPEPVRKPQVEGNQAMLPPPSIATPDVPPQSAQAAPPTIAAEHPTTQPAPPSVSAPEHPQPPAAPPVPEMEAVPIAAQPAPAVNVQPNVDTKPIAVPHERPQIAAPSIKVADAELEAVPVPEQARPSLDSPKLPPVKAQVKAGTIQRPDIARPEITAAPAPDAAASRQEASAAQAQQAKATEGSKSQESASAPASTAGRENDVSTAPNARPTGSDNATPGEQGGTDRPVPGAAGRNGLDLRLPSGQGSGQGGNPGQGQGQAQAGNSEQGAIGQYIQLKPRGNTNVMSHGTPNIGYKATRFEKDWTPEGESSLDTALRHAVEKTTVSHTFHVAPGVRVKCSVRPLFPLALFGCGFGDKPPEPVDDKVYERMKLAPTNPLVPPKPAASTAAPAKPIKLDNSVECTNARISGGPLPPGCLDDTLNKPTTPAPPKSWVPASDQFH